jgi:hypothetical protein
MPTKVSYFGIHWSEAGIAFLEQEKAQKTLRQRPEPSGSNALGLAVKSSFFVEPPKRQMRCPHLIPLAVTNPDVRHLEAFYELADDPLVQVLLPVPKDDAGSFYLNQSDFPDEKLSLYLTLLCQMSSPVTSLVTPIWALTLPQIMDELNLTNVAPLVLTGVTSAHTELVNKVGQVVAHAPRTLLLVGASDVALPPIFTRVRSKLAGRPLEQLMLLPWSVLGAVCVRRYMRNEAIIPEVDSE